MPEYHAEQSSRDNQHVKGLAVVCGVVLIAAAVSAVDWRWGVGVVGAFLLIGGVIGLIMGR